MYRKEYPQPQFEREHWQNLNGQWDFDFDDEDKGQRAQWYKEHDWTREIQVPFAYQSHLSGIEDTAGHPVVWYQRSFESTARSNEDVLLHFGAVDYTADIWLDGQYIGHHQGGHTAFTFDVSPFVTAEKQQHTLTVRAWDPVYDEEITRGKQNWVGQSVAIWYTNTTGIWQTVWLEYVPNVSLDTVQYFPDITAGTVTIKGRIRNFVKGAKVTATVTFEGEPVNEITVTPTNDAFVLTVDVFNNQILRSGYHNDGRLWSPEHPHLFDVDFTTTTADTQDQVKSYFGMREVRTESGMIFLNNRPYYQRMALDQGYWPDGLLTAPNDEAFKKDIQLAKDMGLNGVRLHQKVEDPRFLYWADQLGLICWGECASAPVFSSRSESALYGEWQEIIDRDFNHPAIITWVPLNESWGVRSIHDDRQEQHFSQALYHLIHSLDPTRLVQSNDGWEQTETDICAIHNYNHGASADSEQYAYFRDTLSNWQKLISQPPGSFDIFAKGFHYSGQPILLTEFGGIGYNKDDAQAGWGYTGASSDTEFLDELKCILSAVAASKSLNGYCYTQLYDTEQEVNGLATYDREPKVPAEKIRKIMEFFVPSYVDAQSRDAMIGKLSQTTD